MGWLQFCSFGTEASNQLPSGWYLAFCICYCMSACVLSHLSPVWLFVTLWTVAREDLLSMGFSRQEYWEGVVMASSRGSSRLKDWKLCLLWFLHCMWILYHWATSEARTCYSSFLRYLLIHLFIWLYQILVVACRIFSFGMWTLSFGIWDLIPWPGIEPIPPVLGAWSLSHWTTREIPYYYSWFLITNCP